MIRALILLFSACWAFLLLLPRARNHNFKEMFRAPKIAPAAIIVAAALLFTLAFLYNYSPQAGDATYYFGASNRFIYTGDLLQDGHEFSLGFISTVRIMTERILGLPLSASIITITFALMLLYCFAIYRFTLAGTKNLSLSLLAAGIAPFSMFTFWFVFGGAYAQFLALSLFLLGISFYFQRAPNWKPAILLALGTLAHVWSGVVFAFAFGVFLLLARVLRYEEYPKLTSRAFKALAASLFVLLSIGLVFRYWVVFVEFDYLRPSSFFFSGLGESPIIAMLAFLGLAVVVGRKIPFCLFLFSLALVTSLALFLHGSFIVSRVVFLFPIPVLAAFGIHRLWESIRNRWMGFVAVGGLICAMALASVYMNKQYIDAQRLNVSGTHNLQTLDELQEITETYGFENRDLLIVIERQNFDLRIWVEALTRAKVVTVGAEIDAVIEGDYVPNRKIIYLGVLNDSPQKV